MSRNQYSVGILILAAGVVILLGKLGVFSFIGNLFWPILILIPGVLLHVFFFGRLLPSVVLVPAGILSVYGLLFLFSNIVGWGSMRYLWPVFILGVAAGLYEYYLFDMSKPRGAQVAAMVLAVVALACFGVVLFWSWGIYFIALALIALGAWLAFGRRYRW
ncbi:hypothetical protein BG53_14625 [Paenibacillus darwinianus]|uniref:DUF5668 domain-containing protein n=1 Tax=Paenibacillus darwinianus TaxID=1380763 RepID=A0A9W5W8T0_9BACL|nr:hypothetical protein [Paenibacillus darwinianus]EXX91839.1 hypothetical protein BG52_06690 [Paenibacillus darwinianus]EXX92373.1 hypothetical protein BG53_14625 [Paenibacillus darwinianus]EXX92727.1 hypothetical protein CH50_02000 [Paenibacillus darwinianus]